MKKIAYLFIVSALFILGLIACSEKRQEESPAASQPESGEQAEKSAAKAQTELTVFAAASLTESLDRVIEAYKKTAPDVKIIVSYDSSGTLKTQIQEGAPCDIFISAAQKQMNQLDASKDAEGGSKEGLDYVLPGSRVDLLINKVVLAVPADNKAEIASFEDLGSDRLKLLCIGNEDVPAGAYSEEILKNLKLWDKLQSEKKLTYGSNVKEVTTHIKEGLADAGIIYATDAFSAGLKIVAAADGKLCSQVIYPAAVMKNTKNEKAAREFLNFLQGPEAIKEFAAVGFSPASK